MDISAFFKKNWVHFAAVGIFLIVCSLYFNLQLKGYGLKQHDIEQYTGASHEIVDYREHNNGEEPLWTNSMFGGMPATQISLIHSGNYFAKMTTVFLKTFPSPLGIVLLYMLGFYMMLSMMKINRWLSVFGSLTYAFLSYQIIILQAGHNSKGIAIAFMAPVVGAFYYAFRRNWMWGAILSALFMAFEMAANHLQITYYLGFLLLGLGIAEVFRVIKSKDYKTFLKATAGIIVGYGLALIINYGNIAMTNDYAKFSIRGANDLTISADGNSNDANSTDGLDRDYVTQYSYGKGESFNFISPYVKGAGTMQFSASPFVSTIEQSDLSPDQQAQVMDNYAYWGEQPATSGPVYLGIILVFLALLGLVYIKDPSKWALFGVAVLTVMLSWGKNYMGLTNWFLDHIPGYNKFRAVTIILVIVELCIPLLAVLLVNKLIKERETIKENLKPFYITAAVFFVFVLGLKFVGIDKSYLSARESDQSGLELQLKKQRKGIEDQIMALSPEDAAKYQIDKSNPLAIKAAVDSQIDGMRQNYLDGLSATQTIRKSVFNSSMNRSILFLLLGIGCLLVYFRTTISSALSLGALGVIALLDVLTVTTNYLNNSEVDGQYKYWVPKLDALYPVKVEEGDLQILEMETRNNPALAQKIDKAKSEGKSVAMELDAIGSEERAIENAYIFAALNRNTNYRVYEPQAGFNSARSSYFHKSLGGYHGAKLRTIQNLADFHIYKSNNKVFDMLNVKYFLQATQQGIVAQPNETAMGNGWLVRKSKVVSSADDEILSLGSKFHMVNIGTGKFLVNGEPKKEIDAYGSEHLQYLIPGKSDTLEVPLSNGIESGVEVVFVQDINGKTNLIMKQGFDQDTTKSFAGLVAFKVTSSFNPSDEAIINKDEVKKIKKNSWKGEGTVKMVSYAPNKLVYTVSSSDDGFAVFSEVYYPKGWSATINGKPADIVKVDYLLRGLEVPKGDSKVVFTYTDEKFNKLNMYSGLGSIALILLTLVAAVMAFLKKRKTPEVQ